MEWTDRMKLSARQTSLADANKLAKTQTSYVEH